MAAMPMRKKQFETMDEYIRSFPEPVRTTLEKVRKTVRDVAPEATEAISYQIPTFKINGKYLVYFAAWKQHIAMYPIPLGTEAFQNEIAPHRTGKGTLRFPMDRPIPWALVKRLVKFHMREREEKQPTRRKNQAASRT